MSRICTGLGGGPCDEVEVEAFFSLDIEYKIDEDGFVYDNDTGEAVGRYHKNIDLFSMHSVMKSLVAIEQPDAAEQPGAAEQPDAIKSPYMFPEVTEERIDEFANKYRGSEGALVFVTKV